MIIYREEISLETEIVTSKWQFREQQFIYTSYEYEFYLEKVI